MGREELLLKYYRAMLGGLGSSQWWPAESPFEVAVGAVLTQNASWENVKKAIENIKGAGLLDGPALYALPEPELAELIRPAGYYRLKAGRLRNLLRYLDESCGFDFAALSRKDMNELRAELLAVKGVGPETADSILLYALNLPSFVIDAYTYRVLTRHGLVSENAGYEEMREFFMDVLEPDPKLFNEYHALFVRIGKERCKKQRPLCAGCALESFLS